MKLVQSLKKRRKSLDKSAKQKPTTLDVHSIINLNVKNFVTIYMTVIFQYYNLSYTFSNKPVEDWPIDKNFWT